MLKHNFLTYGGQILLQIFWEIVYFPLWWYSVGLGRLLKNTRVFLRNQAAVLGFWVWVKNLFTPMYGQNDFTGKIISFFIRLFQIIFRGLALLIVSILSLAFIIFYLALPVILIFLIIHQFS